MPRADTVGPHHVVPFRPERNATLDSLRWARKRPHVPTLLEVDVTAARAALRQLREHGTAPGFTAWVVYCVARAAAEHPRVHALRKGRRRLVVFEEVDITVLVERTIGDADGQETLPMPVVVRAADRKTPSEIHQELRRARDADVRPGAAALDDAVSPRLQALFFRLPRPLRDLLFWRWLLRSPTRMKATMGTVAVTSVGMTVPGVMAWGIPLSLHPLAVAVGGIAERHTATGTREALALSVVFDHAITDGAPVGRFIHRLNQLMTAPAGLDPADP